MRCGSTDPLCTMNEAGGRTVRRFFFTQISRSVMRTFVSSATALICIVITAFLVVAWTAPPQKQEALQIVTARYVQDVTAFQESIEKTKTAVESGSDEDIRTAVAAMRIAFKRTEFLMNFSDPEFTDDFINGAPLPSLERNTGDVTILEPEGLQVIDETAFAPEGDNIDRDKMRELLQLLAKRMDLFRSARLQHLLTDQNIFEAVRLNLIRVFSLGLTGFDTPGSLNAIPEAHASFEAMEFAMRAYYDRLNELEPNYGNDIDHEHVRDISDCFINALISLEQASDFNSFDRLAFLRESVNPLFSLTLRAHLALDIPTFGEDAQRRTPINYMADNLFSPELLNAHYYTRSSPEEAGDDVVALGKLLFFDPILSVNNQRACASCHKPEKAFTDGLPKSVALDFAGTLERNAPTLVNAVFSDRFFYDLRASKLNDQIEHVVTNEREFHSTFIEIADKLNKSDEYRELFRRAYPQLGDRPIVAHSIAGSVAAYVRSLVAMNSEFDRYARREVDRIDPAVQRGFNVFMGKAACGTCHFAPNFNGLVPPYFVETETEVLGVPATPDTLNPTLDSDLGRWGGRLLERAPFYKHSFKTVTLRNVELTAPYMHNGVYRTLEEVVDFYNRGGGVGLGLDVEHQTLAPDRLDLTDQERADLVAFMHALTDTSGVSSRPTRLPQIDGQAELNKRRIGGEY